MSFEHDAEATYGFRSSAVHVLFGAVGGLTSVGSQYFLANDLVDYPDPIAVVPAVGDVDGDGLVDLVLASVEPMVAVLHGNSDGVHPTRLAEASSPGEDAWWPMLGDRETWDAVEVCVGDITGDGNPDALMSPGLRVILGTAAGLGEATNWLAPGYSNPTQDYRFIGDLLLSGGSHAWVVAGRYDEYAELDRGGSVLVMRGQIDGTAGTATVWSQDSPGIKGAAEPGDGFGTVIAG